MDMYFWWGYVIKDYLVSGLSAHTVGGLVGLCLCVGAISFTFEFLRYLQALHRHKELALRSAQLRTICPSDTSALLSGAPSTSRARAAAEVQVKMTQRFMLCSAEVSLWFLLLNLGYIVMLSVMRYNGWIFFAAVIGGGLGYFIFGQMFMKLSLQNCQIIRDTWCMEKCGDLDANPTTPNIPVQML